MEQIYIGADWVSVEPDIVQNIERGLKVKKVVVVYYEREE